uniref:RING-type domain-containing protein n=1 Tax=Arcella intermedia TaxID=1963864 RepID=A0A6B2LDR8_9EUKA
MCRAGFVDPRMVPCGHTYCRGCLESLQAEGPRCPLCQHPFESIDSLPKDQLLSQIKRLQAKRIQIMHLSQEQGNNEYWNQHREAIQEIGEIDLLDERSVGMMKRKMEEVLKGFYLLTKPQRPKTQTQVPSHSISLSSYTGSWCFGMKNYAYPQYVLQQETLSIASQIHECFGLYSYPRSHNPSLGFTLLEAVPLYKVSFLSSRVMEPCSVSVWCRKEGEWVMVGSREMDERNLKFEITFNAGLVDQIEIRKKGGDQLSIHLLKLFY